MKMKKSKVSIVLPIYNVEKYLRRCIDSVINQTLREIEIILVDDGSPDDCGQICDEYCKKDERIKVIHQKNRGLSAARNSGIEIATSEYICFIDSDDYIEKDMIEYLYNNAKKYNTDITCCGFTNIYENGINEKITTVKEKKIYSSKEALDIHLLSGYIEVVAWNKLYKLELFANIRYPEGLLYEDMLTTYKLLDISNNILLLPDSKYYYCKRKNSIGANTFSNKMLKLLDACDEVTNFTINKYSNLDNIKIAQIQWYIVVLNKMIISNDLDKKLLNKTKKMIKDNLFILNKNNYLNKTRKIQNLLLLINTKLYIFIYKKFLQ